MVTEGLTLGGRHTCDTQTMNHIIVHLKTVQFY